jgi:RNA polymerase sigma-54 factor
MALSLKNRVGQQANLSQQLQQSIRLLQLSNNELEQELTKAADENPLLEFEPNPEIAADASELNGQFQEVTNAWLGNSNRQEEEDWEEKADRIACQATLLGYVEEQIHLLHITTQEQSLINYLAGCLDERGYLIDEIELIAVDITNQIHEKYPLKAIQDALKKLQSLDPPGIGARNLSECLSLQIQRFLDDPKSDLTTWHLAKYIVDYQMNELASKDWLKIRKASGKTEGEILRAVQLIRTLQHNPGAQFEANSNQWVIPDIAIKNKGGRWIAESHPNARPRISIHSEYAKILKESGSKNIDGSLKQKLLEANWLIKNIAQREETILKVAQEIVLRQQQFFTMGALGMKPMVLREIAETLNMHESTISRVTTQKYLTCQLGIFEFKYFFSSQVSLENGGNISSTVIQALIKKIIADEPSSKPISDSTITKILGDQGYIVARRTVAKYREILRIPPVHRRKN